MVEEVEAFRAKHEADYRRSYVTLAGLFPLKPGANTAGSSPTNDIVLPTPVPESIGRFIVDGDAVRFEPQNGTDVSINGKPATASVHLRTDENGAPDQLTIAPGKTLWVHLSGSRRTLRLSDVDGEPARAFTGFHWFPVDERFRVVGRFIRDSRPTRVTLPNQLGDEETYTTEGIVEFTLDGQTVTLRPMTTRPGRLYFIFRDGTSGKETYDTARFLYANLNPDDTVVLDFNQAYNPPCSFNPYTTCPLPPPENRLNVRILAGEKAPSRGPHVVP